VPKKEAERRAWATVQCRDRGGKKSGSGRGKKVDTAPSRKGGRLGGRAAAKRSAAGAFALREEGGGDAQAARGEIVKTRNALISSRRNHLAPLRVPFPHLLERPFACSARS
jgi:hypothetical protein